jgi:long-chain acyl-CoA synthetase
MPVALLEAVEQAFRTTVWEGYGLAETSPLVACNQREYGRRAGTVGHAVPGVDVRIDKPDAASGIGEIVVRGPNVMLGYWNRPDETAAVLTNGWLHTGDLGVIEDGGYLRVVDRAKDVIKRGGAAVYPREVEERLVAHASVREAAVVGVPDDRFGERVVAAVVVEHGVSEQELTSWCRATLSSYKCPVDFRLVEALPRGPTGKVLKRAVRALWSTEALTRPRSS